MKLQLARETARQEIKKGKSRQSNPLTSKSLHNIRITLPLLPSDRESMQRHNIPLHSPIQRKRMLDNRLRILRRHIHQRQPSLPHAPRIKIVVPDAQRSQELEFGAMGDEVIVGDFGARGDEDRGVCYAGGDLGGGGVVVGGGGVGEGGGEEVD